MRNRQFSLFCFVLKICPRCGSIRKYNDIILYYNYNNTFCGYGKWRRYNEIMYNSSDGDTVHVFWAGSKMCGKGGGVDRKLFFQVKYLRTTQQNLEQKNEYQGIGDEIVFPHIVYYSYYYRVPTTYTYF